VSKDPVVNADEHPAYKNPLQQWKQHNSVNHSKLESERKNEDGSIGSTNRAESFFSLLKGHLWFVASCQPRTSSETRRRIRFSLEPSRNDKRAAHEKFCSDGRQRLDLSPSRLTKQASQAL